MKTLLIMRHAKSSWKEQDLPDHDRPLNKRGKNDAPRMEKLLKDEDLVPDLIMSSTAVRAKKTAELVAKTCKYKGKIVLDRSLYGAEPAAYLKILGGLFDQSCIINIIIIFFSCQIISHYIFISPFHFL